MDSGRELMVPTRIAGGERLWKDIAFPHGPLGPYLGAAVERLFGPSLPARTGLAALVALLHLAALDRLARRLLPAERAALATATAVAAAMFLRPGGWLFPFSLDAAIAVAALTWAVELVERGRKRSDALAGLCLAAALLSRVEMGLAGVALLTFVARGEPRRLLRLAAVPLLAAAAGYGATSAGVPFERLIREGWLQVLDPPSSVRSVYRAYAGLDRLELRSAELLLAAILLAVAGALLVGAAFAASRLRRGAATSLAALMLGALTLAAIVRLRPPGRLAATLALLPPLVRVVPLVVLGAALWRLVSRLSHRNPRGPLAAAPDAVLFLAALFAARLLLAAGYVGPYNAFFLPLPIVVAVAGLFGLADRLAPAIGEALPRLVFGAVAVYLVFRVVALTDFYRRAGWSRVETPRGAVVLPEPVAETTRRALADLQARLPAASSLVGFPEGGFFNYVLALRNPFAPESYFPGRLDPAGEARAIAEFRRRPPDITLYANVLAVGEGARSFGTDYLAGLDAAVRSETRVVSIHGPGARPGARIGDPGFFVEIRVPGGRAAP